MVGTLDVLNGVCVGGEKKSLPLPPHWQKKKHMVTLPLSACLQRRGKKLKPKKCRKSIPKMSEGVNDERATVIEIVQYGISGFKNQ